MATVRATIRYTKRYTQPPFPAPLRPSPPGGWTRPDSTPSPRPSVMSPPPGAAVNVPDGDEAVGHGAGPHNAPSHASSILRSGSGSASRWSSRTSISAKAGSPLAADQEWWSRIFPCPRLQPARPAYSRQESQQLFPRPQPGAEKRRSGNSETPAAQESEGIVYGGTTDSLWPRCFLSRVFDREMMSRDLR